MSQELYFLRSKVNAGIVAIRELSPKERERPPSLEYADAFNKLRDKVAKALPQIADYLPEPVVTSHGDACHIPYAEFLQKYIEMGSMIDRAEPPPAPRVVRG